jgi:hypothetical protein
MASDVVLPMRSSGAERSYFVFSGMSSIGRSTPFGTLGGSKKHVRKLRRLLDVFFGALIVQGCEWEAWRINRNDGSGGGSSLSLDDEILHTFHQESPLFVLEQRGEEARKSVRGAANPSTPKGRFARGLRLPA